MIWFIWFDSLHRYSLFMAVLSSWYRVCVKGRASEPHPREVHFNMTGNENDSDIRHYSAFVSLHVNISFKNTKYMYITYYIGVGEILSVWRCRFSIFDPVHALRLFPHPPFSICTAFYLIQIMPVISIPVWHDARDINLTGALGRAHRWSVTYIPRVCIHLMAL